MADAHDKVGLSSRRLLRRGALLLCLGLTVVSLQVPGQNSVSQADIDALVAEIERLQNRLEQNRAERSRMAQRLEESEREIAANRRRLSDVESALAETEDELTGLRSRERTLEARRQEQARDIETLLVSAYKSQQQTPLKALLSPDSLSHGQRMMTFYQYFNAAQVAELRAYEQTLTELLEVTAGIAARQADLEAQNAQLIEENNRLLQNRNERRQVVARLAEEIATQEQEVAEKEAEREELEALLREVEQALEQFEFGDDEIPFADLRGQMGWPVEGEVRLRYGQRNERTNLVSDGLLVAAEPGSSVRAIHYGRVVFSDYLKGYGLMVIIDHGEGYLSLYGRNEVLERDVGDWVRGGETIAQVGDSGGFSEPALYFEVRHRGEPTDPQNWLAR
ncbi:MAG: peptidoglycan DD-metalloendopeptidase family protein [Natronospirillum sp.]|uniref:murein hydrolase activator EnvC family protein n=1 Tax=Natronospirillum sp. TaxID=2812955 RepID=UPI0025D20FF1|nr:peptidoglycan DD-metalloendopeptidase family protein [Natronospirillum sp.]MCH8550783.1 peptidoglycan DD-metalloendopeptidase family protein [Natronospirillum sp.]